MLIIIIRGSSWLWYKGVFTFYVIIEGAEGGGSANDYAHIILVVT